MAFDPAAVEWHDVVASTMDLAYERALAGAPHGCVVAAREQAQGRGRRGNAWLSGRDQGVFLTAVVRPQAQVEAPLPALAIAVGVGLVAALGALGISSLKVKWPNDIRWLEGKLGGVLLQSEVLPGGPVVLVGVGVNVAPASAVKQPEGASAPYVGTRDALPDWPAGALGVQRLLPTVLEGISRGVVGWERDWPQVRADFAAVDALEGAQIRAQGPAGLMVGQACGLAEDGGLRVQTPDGLMTVTSGEVWHVVS